MERIVLRHLSGSKSNQVEEFPLNHFKELSIGRDPSSTVKYDPDRDDLVGRLHAKIAQDVADPTQFYLTDMNSRNGTFLNKQRIVGTTKIVPGDLVQFGPAGPEFQFDLEPRPAGAIRTTRIGTETSPNAPTVPSTRIGQSGGVSSNPYMPATTPGGMQPGGVGKATVERMITQQKSDSKKFVVIGLIVMVLLIGVVAAGIIGYNIYSNKGLQSQLSGTQNAVASINAKATMTPADIVKNYTNSVVYIESGWKLIYTRTGSQVYQHFIPNRYRDKDGIERYIVPDGRAEVAAYVSVDGNTIEPLLTATTNNHPIGGELTGSGFVVTSDGFILTNRHVAATWRTSYHFGNDAVPGVVYQNGQVVFSADGSPALLRQAPGSWVPSETKQAGLNLQGGFDGRHDYFNVTFAKNESRIKANLSRVSDHHDAALIKIEIPESVTKVELFDNYDAVQPGDGAIVLGYPAVSPPVYGVVKSQDVFNREQQLKVIPDPTVSVGNVGRVLRSQDNSASGKDSLISAFGDAYQLTINSTGGGNSGGPVFDDHGRVIAIYFAGITGDVQISAAVPIKFGKELMGISPAR